ncbi:hypothetical protein GT037_004772 [Alternaria burnsii]|uniref:Ribophorin II C-terminal domain-containing protein n=1 Tax=Alternaria burnsii TaxID=1187904 RepID=A0A8H7BEJ8_9PLEO|nr:uncharacterized protein GT037_004772 [Alternaria burnsii]KAF7677913.1 hypothetical protein GT037_004772 [Alternaria burnsii]
MLDMPLEITNILGCRHVFGSACVKQMSWDNIDGRHQCCPLCRTEWWLEPDPLNCDITDAIKHRRSENIARDFQTDYGTARHLLYNEPEYADSYVPFGLEELWSKLNLTRMIGSALATEAIQKRIQKLQQGRIISIAEIAYHPKKVLEGNLMVDPFTFNNYHLPVNSMKHAILGTLGSIVDSSAFTLSESAKMRVLQGFVSSLLLSGAAIVSAASSWSFEDATVTVSSKGAGVGGGSKDKLSPSTPLGKSVSLGATDTLKLVLTTLDGSTAKRPHQAFLTLTEPTTGLEESFVFNAKDSGKAKVDLSHKDLPHQFLTSEKPIVASIVIGSFGSSAPYKSRAFDLAVTRDPSVPLSVPAPPVRYAAEAEIHHIFRDDPKSPPKIITIVFAAAVAAALPILLGAWAMLGANANHLSKALGNAPVSHGLFYGSILAMEGIFFLYYTSWNLFQTLPAAAVVGAVAFLSGSRALSEVQERRLAGER